MMKHLYLIFEKQFSLLQKLKCSGQDNCYERWFTDKYRIKERKKETGPVTCLITRYLLNVASAWEWAGLERVCFCHQSHSPASTMGVNNTHL